MESTKEHENYQARAALSEWPRIEPMPAETRQSYKIRIDAHRAEAMRRDFGFPDDCDMAGLLAWPQSFLSFKHTRDHVLTPAERRDTFSKIVEHITELKGLLGLVEVEIAFISPRGDPETLGDLEHIRSALDVFKFIKFNLCLLEDFAAGQARVYSALTTKGRQLQPETGVRLICAMTLLNIWQNHKGDPRGNHKTIARFYEFMAQAFGAIGPELTGDEMRVVQRKLRKAAGSLPKIRKAASTSKSG